MAPRPHAAIRLCYLAGVAAKEFTHRHTHTRTNTVLVWNEDPMANGLCAPALGRATWKSFYQQMFA